ncbi:D-alanine--D-alanine ligase [Streptosporangium sp. NBC_01639]|uniref:D-alanine--D-alanine ligase family protein n=1 Tax=unclassified Streptosporangium TaxID=2632669 RepID=UPI002DD92139|nr:D-alanine--D-alanine ligase family protein [Streptosporangium sp. NBC_01756]WSC88786.1 D-alanine--D-alanine ligase [Streptosporangium sp. NBC_01756]WTD52525.1 D-alanine--D-alanine ligase [Streptosporangium sp. NBC_01639]
MSEQHGTRPRVAIVFGGRNSEHAVSILGAGSVLEAIDRSKYEVIPIGIAQDGRWVLASGDQRYAIEDDVLPSVETDGAGLALPSGGGSLVAYDSGSIPVELGQVDVVFPVMHGPFAEDGTIQGLLEMAGVRYVGSGVLASAVGMDKAYMKIVLAAAGLPVGPYVVIRDRDWRIDRDRILKEVQELGWPVFVKPARAGSSQGISKAHDLAELERAVEAAREHDPKVLVEAAIVGREIECAVLESLGDEAARASLPGEVLVHGGHEFFNFEAKYIGDDMSLSVPADIPADVAENLRAMAVRAFEALGCEGLSRVDFFYTPDGRLILNEINTMPGFTAMSVAPQLWAATGLPYAGLVDRLIQLALQRSPGLR